MIKPTTISRSSGVLLHITSLPGQYGIGDLGLEAIRFLDFLVESEVGWWQMLPLNPPGYGNSPYQCWSGFAGNPLLISPDLLMADGLLRTSDLEDLSLPELSGPVDFSMVPQLKEQILHRAMERFEPDQEFNRFCEEEQFWLEDAAMFRALSLHYDGRPWTEWESDVAHRDPAAMKKVGEILGDEIAFERFTQYLFYRQHRKLRQEAAKRNIRLIGDLPIFVAHNSADVWSNQELFFLDNQGEPTSVAGVPPDYFSKTGQRWGNPLYRWDIMAENGYSWWISRLRSALRLYDAVRVDHFRGFESYWEIPADAKTAVNGQWIPGPGADFFEVVGRELENPMILAEDLGIITPEVESLRDRFGFPGMKVLQFGAGNPDSPHLPHNFATPDCVVYTGTHDNNTTLGWWKSLSRQEKKFMREYTGKSSLGRSLGGDVAEEMVRLALASTATLAILPMQDVLGLGGEARMNVPGESTTKNWTWRMEESAFATRTSERLAGLNKIFGRNGASLADQSSPS